MCNTWASQSYSLDFWSSGLLVLHKGWSPASGGASAIFAPLVAALKVSPQVVVPASYTSKCCGFVMLTTGTELLMLWLAAREWRRGRGYLYLCKDGYCQSLQRIMSWANLSMHSPPSEVEVGIPGSIQSAPLLFHFPWTDTDIKYLIINQWICVVVTSTHSCHSIATCQLRLNVWPS